jgi:hypothetical protein
MDIQTLNGQDDRLALFQQQDHVPAKSSGKSCSFSCTMSDLCAEDKKKISDLLRKVIFLTEDNDRAWKEVALEKKARSDLANQNRELASELASLKSKLSHSLELLRSYQVRARDMQHFLSRCTIPGDALFESANLTSSVMGLTESEASGCKTLVASGKSSADAPSNESVIDADGPIDHCKSSLAVSTQFPSPPRPSGKSAQGTHEISEHRAPFDSSPLEDDPFASHPHKSTLGNGCRDQGAQYSPRPLPDSHLFHQPTLATATMSDPLPNPQRVRSGDKENIFPLSPPLRAPSTSLGQGRLQAADLVDAAFGSEPSTTGAVTDPGRSRRPAQQHPAAVTAPPAGGGGGGASRACTPIPRPRAACGGGGGGSGGGGLSPRAAMCIAAAALRESTPAPKPPPPAPHGFQPRPSSAAPTPPPPPPPPAREVKLSDAAAAGSERR